MGHGVTGTPNVLSPIGGIGFLDRAPHGSLPELTRRRRVGDVDNGQAAALAAPSAWDDAWQPGTRRPGLFGLTMLDRSPAAA